MISRKAAEVRSSMQAGEIVPAAAIKPVQPHTKTGAGADFAP